jgi:pyruvate dehydrogenase E1 component beta subunit
MRLLQYNEAINEALSEELARDEKVFLLGEGVGVSSLATTRGLVQKFGPDRVIDTPIAEAAITGCAIGAATMGYRPIADLMYSDFLYTAADDVLIRAPQWRFLHGGRQSLPIVFIAGSGGYRKVGPEHSHSPHSIMLHHPGLKVVVPSTPYDAKGLLKASIRDDNPVFYMFHKALIGMKEDIPEEEYIIPLGQAKVRREGTDVTVVAASYMNYLAIQAADKLKGEISVEVIDPRTLEPLDLDTILKSVIKTGRVVIVDEDTERCGFAGELMAQIMEHAFDELDAPIKRVCAANYPIPSGFLEKFVLPQPAQILAAIREVVK